MLSLKCVLGERHDHGLAWPWLAADALCAVNYAALGWRSAQPKPVVRRSMST